MLYPIFVINSKTQQISFQIPITNKANNTSGHIADNITTTAAFSLLYHSL
jgi:hypothetical protein